jgi:hypothetical protein
MKLNPDPRLPLSPDSGLLGIRLNEIFREIALDMNAIFAQVHTGTTLGNYANDTAAAGGVAIGEFYRNGSVVMQRVT